MSTLKYSRQRESIKVCLQGRKDHPTADMLYTENFPISVLAQYTGTCLFFLN